MDTSTFEMLRRCEVPENVLNSRDLSGVDLAQKVLVGVDLRGFDVSKTNLERAYLAAADLRGLQFASTNCVRASFVGADMRGANLAFGYFHGSDFRGADMRGAHLTDAVCNGCCFAGADLRGAVFGHEHYDSDFRGADLRGAIIPDDCDFARLNCDMRGAAQTPREAAADLNKRHEPRIQLLRPLRVFDRATGKQAGVLVDITTEGIRITSQKPLPVGVNFSFQIQLPEASKYGRSLNLEVTSMWCKSAADGAYHNTGFRMANLDEKDAKIIERLIEDHKSIGFAIIDK
jgi:uncharacterized protein YjbI with pentapeptide repeats